MGGECGDQLAIDPAGFASRGDRRQDIPRERLASGQQVAVSRGQVRIGRIHGITATPTSSTSALGSNSSVTPRTANAG